MAIQNDGFGTIVKNIGQGGGGGGSSSSFVYRNSEPSPAGNVYATFQEAYDAAKAAGVATIYVDTSLIQGGAPTGSGTYDFAGVTLCGYRTNGDRLVLGDAEGNPATVTHLGTVKNLTLQSASNGTPITIAGVYEDWVFDHAYLDNQSSAPLVLIDGSGEAGLSVTCYGGGFSNSSCFRVVNQGGVTLSLFEQSDAGYDILSGDNVSFASVRVDLSSSFSSSQPSFLGELSYEQLEQVPEPVFIWRSNTRAPYIYPTLAEALSAAQDYGRSCVVVIDSNDAVPAGTYDQQNITFRGAAPNLNSAMIFNEGVQLNNDADLRVENLSVVFNVSATAPYTPLSRNIYAKNCAFYNGSSVAGINLSQGGATVYLENTTIQGSGSPDGELIELSSYGLDLYLSGSSQVADNTIRGSGYLSITTNAESQVSLNQPGHSGQLTLTRLDQANLVGYTPATPANWGTSAPVQVAQALDNLAAMVKGFEVVTLTTDNNVNENPAPLDPTKQFCVVINTTGGTTYAHLADGTDGAVKEIVNGVNSGTDLVYVSFTSNQNNGLDIGTNTSARMVWITSQGGWVVLSTCNTVNNLWD